MSIHEECGVFGVMAPVPCNVASISYYGLYSLQHRGQESCGIVVNDDGVFSSHKDLGLVNEVALSVQLLRVHSLALDQVCAELCVVNVSLFLPSPCYLA